MLIQDALESEKRHFCRGKLWIGKEKVELEVRATMRVGRGLKIGNRKVGGFCRIGGVRPKKNGRARSYRALACRERRIQDCLRRDKSRRTAKKRRGFGFLIGRPLFSVLQLTPFSLLIYDTACRFCGLR